MSPIGCVKVASGGLPVSQAAIGFGAPFLLGTSGIAVTVVPSGGLPIADAGGSGGGIFPPTSVLATLDGTKSSQIILSNGNLTATLNPSAGGVGVASSAFKTNGKFYFEATAGPTHSSNGTGVMTSAADFVGMVNSGVASLIVYTFGQIWAAGGSSGKALGALVQTDVIGHAYDLTARKGWARKNGGNWNGLAIGSENPATGLGGITLPTGGLAPAVGFGGGAQIINDAWTFNFGQSAFRDAAPAGFGNWSSP